MFPRSAVRRPASFAATVRELESLESRLALAAISSVTTSVTEVVTNTPQVVELFDTRVYAPGGEAVAPFRFDFDRTLPVRYDPAEPTVAAAVAEAVAHVTAGFPGRTVRVITSSDVQLGSLTPRTYPQTFRLLTRVDPAPVEVGRSDTIVETVTVETVGPATVRVGANAAESLFVPAGDTHTNTVTRVRRDIATVSSQTYTTTQLVLVVADPLFPPVGGVTTFSVSSRHLPVLAEAAAGVTRETSAVRVVGTFGGRRYDVTIDGATSPTDGAVQAAVATARESLWVAGATGVARVVVGAPVRERVGSETGTTVQTENTAFQPALDVHTTPAGVFQVSPALQPGEGNGVADYVGPTLLYIGDLTSRGSARLFYVPAGSTNIDIFSERTGTVTTTRTTTDTYRTLLTVEVIGEAGPVDARPWVFSTTTRVDEVVTNTPRVVERYDTRVLVGNGNGFAFDQTLPVRFDPAGPTDPAVAASIAAAQAVVNPADPASVRVTTSSTIDRGAVSDSATDRPYSQIFRRLTANDTAQVETGRTDTGVETVTVETVGPATVRVGPNGADTLFVPAGTVHVNTITRVRRDIATATTQTFTTTQLVLVGEAGSLPGSGHFIIASRTRPTLVTENATATAETAATRVIATFGGVHYDVTLDVPYDPTNPAVQAAIAAAQAAVRAAGATTGVRVSVGVPVRGRVSSAASVGETTATSEYVSGGGGSHSLPDGVHAIVPPPAADEEYSPGFVNYIGPTAYFAGDEFADVVAVGAGTYALDLLQDRTAVTTRTRTTTDTYQTLTTVEVVGDDGPSNPPTHVFLRAVGADSGGAPRVRALRADGTAALDTFAFESSFTGGVRVATGDVTGDGVDDVLTAAGDGGGPRVRVFDGTTGAAVADYFAFPDTLRVGAFVAAADVNGDGFADYAVSAGSGGGPRVALFDGRTGARLLDFLAFNADDRHGVTVALGDVTGDGVPDISVGQLAGGTAVHVFDLSGNSVAGFDAYEPGFAGGVYLAVADADADGLLELLTGAGPGGAPRVRGFRAAGEAVTEVANGFRFDPAGRDGVRVGTGRDVVTAAASGRVRLFPTAGGADPTVEAPFGDRYVGGLWVS